MQSTVPAIAHFALPREPSLRASIKSFANRVWQRVYTVGARLLKRRRRSSVYAGALVTLASINGHTLADIGVRPGGISEYASVVADHPRVDPRDVLGPAA
ncbi:MAG: hypothetical protein AAF458_18110 [Pseudomonadota bacterium]